jgi:hypothetical protein
VTEKAVIRSQIFSLPTNRMTRLNIQRPVKFEFQINRNIITFYQTLHGTYLQEKKCIPVDLKFKFTGKSLFLFAKSGSLTHKHFVVVFNFKVNRTSPDVRGKMVLPYLERQKGSSW